MITIDAPISFLVGGAIALASKDPTRPQVRDRSTVLLKGVLMQSVILTPMILFFMLRFPDWEWNYMFNAQQFFFDNATPLLGIGLIVLITALINLSFVVGFRVVEELIKRNKNTRALQILAATVALIGVIMLLMFKQTIYLGTYAQYQAETAQLVFTNFEFVGVLAVGGVALVAAGFWILQRQAPQQAA